MLGIIGGADRVIILACQFCEFIGRYEMHIGHVIGNS